jgi:hypothetical protein
MNSKDLTLRVSRRAVAVGAVVVAVAAVLFAHGITTSSAQEPGQRLTVYSVAQKQIYVNNQDDRERGVDKNPFTEGSVPSPTPSTLPAAGDQTLAVAGIYAKPGKQGKEGESAETCFFNFSKNASCDLTIRLKGGNLEASGAIHFDSKNFVLAIVGGTGAYSAAGGELKVSPASKNAQKFVISLAE